jgi:uncharacterized protein (DUF2336 family)
MQAPQSLIAELESSLNSGPSAKRSEILRRVTDLFLTGGDTYNDEHIGVFDDVMNHLVQKIEGHALIELSGRLAPIDFAPSRIVNRLARDDNMAVAGPILEKSSVLSDADLIDISRTKTQDHMAAIAGRVTLAEAVTDILVERGNADVTRRVSGNLGARFSRYGIETVAGRAEKDEAIAEALAQRRDLPPEVFDELVRKATKHVRERLMANSAPGMQERIVRTVATVSRQVALAEAPASAAGGHGAKIRMNSAAVAKNHLISVARAGHAAETISAFARVCGVPVAAIKNLVRQGADDGFIILGKAAGLGWPEMKDVLATAMPADGPQASDQKALFEKFVGISSTNAQRVVRFIKTAKAASKEEIRKLM